MCKSIADGGKRCPCSSRKTDNATRIWKKNITDAAELSRIEDARKARKRERDRLWRQNQRAEKAQRAAENGTAEHGQVDMATVPLVDTSASPLKAEDVDTSRSARRSATSKKQAAKKPQRITPQPGTVVGDIKARMDAEDAELKRQIMAGRTASALTDTTPSNFEDGLLRGTRGTRAWMKTANDGDLEAFVAELPRAQRDAVDNAVEALGADAEPSRIRAAIMDSVAADKDWTHAQRVQVAVRQARANARIVQDAAREALIAQRSSEFQEKLRALPRPAPARHRTAAEDAVFSAHVWHDEVRGARDATVERIERLRAELVRIGAYEQVMRPSA